MGEVHGRVGGWVTLQDGIYYKRQVSRLIVGLPGLYKV